MSSTKAHSASSEYPSAGMRMSAQARATMRGDEKVMLKYYNDMGKKKGSCTWGIGFYVHKGVCTEEELKRKVNAPSIDIEYDKRIAEAERRVKLKVKVALNQAQFDGLVSFTYNTRNETNKNVYEALNRNDLAAAASIISSAIYTTVKGKPKLAPGLIKRRAAESAPFRVSQEQRKAATQ